MPRATALGEAQLARDVGAALAARLDQLAAAIAPPLLQDVDDARGSARRGPAFRPVCASTKRSISRQAAVDRLEVALEAQVVGQVELADARGVAAAAEVLEQQRVVELASDRLAGRPISRPMCMPIQQQRTQWPGGWPSVMSSA